MKRARAEVRRRFVCPRCGGAHAAAECDADVAHLDAHELRRLRRLALEELGHAMLHGADQEHVDGVLGLLAGVETRLARESNAPLPTLTRRQQLAGEAGPYGFGR